MAGEHRMTPLALPLKSAGCRCAGVGPGVMPSTEMLDVVIGLKAETGLELMRACHPHFISFLRFSRMFNVIFITSLKINYSLPFFANKDCVHPGVK